MVFSGAAREIRTLDHPFTRRALYQAELGRHGASRAGFEPATFRVGGGYAIQLRHRDGVLSLRRESNPHRSITAQQVRNLYRYEGVSSQARESDPVPPSYQEGALPLSWQGETWKLENPRLCGEGLWNSRLLGKTPAYAGKVC